MLIGIPNGNRHRITSSVFLTENISITVNTLWWDRVLAASQDKACQDITVKLQKRKQNSVKAMSFNVSGCWA